MNVLITLAQGIDVSTFPNTAANSASMTKILDIVFSITGSIALLLIVIGGFRYIVARGEPAEVTKAKNTILYAVIGLVVTLTAFGIVTFVINGIK